MTLFFAFVARGFYGLCALCVLQSCGSLGSKPVANGGPLAFQVNKPAVKYLQSINKMAVKCWIDTKEFKGYGIVPELDTRAGKPRILLLQVGSVLPQWVIEAHGRRAQVSTYGPLTNKALSLRMNSDVMRWSSGDTSCNS